MRRAALVAAALAACAAAGAAQAQQPTTPPTQSPRPATGAPATVVEPEHPAFLVRSDSGLDFVHRRFTTPAKKYLPEITGSGIGLLDYDGDGLLDVYCAQCCPLPGYPEKVEAPPDALYRNLGRVGGRFRFERVADRVTVKQEDGTPREAPLGLGDREYSMSVTCPDVDNDGRPDLFVTNVGQDVLYRNNGDGTFTDVTAQSGIVDAWWTAAAAWGDFDGDGDLDLYLANYGLIDYVRYTVCGTGDRVGYCSPDVLKAAPDRLFRNDGGFRFTDVTKEAGIVEPDHGGKGLAAIPFDHDDDGRLDLYVANDADPNFLWHNVRGADGKMKFEEIAGEVGLAVNGQGTSQSCMGSDIADVNGDLRFDVYSANLSKESSVLYLRTDGDYYEDATYKSGIGNPTYLFTGFGARFFDFDRDADLDLFQVNGHVLDDIRESDPNQSFEQVPLFLENRGDGTFLPVGPKLSRFFQEADVGRGLAVGDLDGDGDLDAVVVESDHPLRVLENVLETFNHWIGLFLAGDGKKSPRDAIGARVTLACGDKTQVQEVRGSSSYMSWQDLRVHFGVGPRTVKATATIRWPSGRVQVVKELELDRYHLVREEGGEAPGGSR